MVHEPADRSEGSAYDSDSDYESDLGSSTPLTTPQTPRTPRPSELKVHHCTFDGCTKSFNRLSRLAEHQRSHTGQRIFKCSVEGCDKDFLRESHLKHHVKSAHTDIRDYVCTWDGCDKSFATGTRLRRHLAAHEGREKYRCRGYDGCNETFRKHATLTRHILTVHQGQKAFPCPDDNLETGEKCSMAFDTAEKLRAHQRAQHDPTRFSCTVCLDAILAMNVQGDDENDLEVDTSQAYFPTYALLQAHTAEVHPPTCPHCLSTCSTQRELRRHIETIHGFSDPVEGTILKYEFPCTYPGCNRSFTRRGNLNVHMTTVHKGERAFVCGQTDLSTSKKVPLPPNPEQVEYCGRSFTSKNSLEEHVRTVHLGLQSRQMERKMKRKAAVDDDEKEQQASRKTKVNSAKRTKTVLSNLTGVHEAPLISEDAPQHYENDSYFENPSFSLLEPQITDQFAFASHDNDTNHLVDDGKFREQQCIDHGMTGLGPAIDPLLLLI